jgi:D-alanyl-D-alanine dipeptidase
LTLWDGLLKMNLIGKNIRRYLMKNVFRVLIPALIISCSGYQADSARLIDIQQVNPNILLDIRYATKNNFLHEAVYPVARCFVLQAVAMRLDSIQRELETRGLGLKIFDGYRPYSVTKKMWEIMPDERYVANPKNGSRHNRGAAVDLTLVDSTGKELEMPTGFDDFSEKAGQNYMDLPDTVIKNRNTLKNIMIKYGFVPISSEWWHYDLKGYEQYPILDKSFEEIDLENL